MAFRIYSGKKISVYNVTGGGAVILQTPTTILNNRSVIVSNAYKATPSGTGF